MPSTFSSTLADDRNPRPFVIYCGRHFEDLRAVTEARLPGTTCSTLPTALKHVRAAPDAILFVDMDVMPNQLPGELARWLETNDVGCPVIIRYDLRSTTSTELYALARTSLDVRVSFRGYEDLPQLLRRVSVESVGSATLAILRRIDGRVPVWLRPLMGEITVLGERIVSEAAVAAVRRMGCTTLRDSLRNARAKLPNIPTFPTINATVLAVHYLHSREILGNSPKRAAAVCGFRTAPLCDNYLRYHLGFGSRQLLRLGGSAYVLGLIDGWFDT